MLHRYFDLILYKTYADLRAEAERTYLGFLWWIIEPILYMSVFYVFFGVLLKQGEADFLPFLLIGLVMWQWFKSCLSHGAETILGGHALMQSVRIPKLIFPVVLILTDTVKFAFIFALLLCFLWLYGYPLGAAYLALPAVMITQLVLTAALTFLLAGTVPFFPDLRFVVENILLAVFFASGIIISSSAIPERYLSLYYLNPLPNLFEAYRGILLYNQWPDWPTLGIVFALSLVAAAGGVLLIGRFEYLYPKITP